MQSNHKIVLFEGELKAGKGHHYNHLVENSFFYKNKGKILWFVNKKFEKKNLFIPKFVKVLNKIDTGNRKIALSNLISIFQILNISIKNFIKSYYFLLFHLKFNKKLFIFLYENFFCFPKYFSSFFSTFKNEPLKKGDKIIFQTARINDLELAYFLSLLDSDIELHIRVIQLHRKKRLKKFLNILNKINNENKLFKSIFIYTETEYQKQEIKKLTGIEVEIFFNNLSFSKKNLTDDVITIGILGESRFDKGFYKVPKLIKSLNSNLNKKINFIIQINNYPQNLSGVKNELLDLSKKFNNIKIIQGYINYFEYREILKKISIIPLLHELDQLKFCGSGLVFSSIVNEIPMVIPKNATYVKNFFKYNSYLEAENILDYSKKIIEIINNYPKFLECAKKQSFFYKEKLNKDFLNNRI